MNKKLVKIIGQYLVLVENMADLRPLASRHGGVHDFGDLTTQDKSLNSHTSEQQRVSLARVGAISSSATQRSHTPHLLPDQERYSAAVDPIRLSTSNCERAAPSPNRSGAVENRHERYSRRKRHKTRPDKYEFTGILRAGVREHAIQRERGRKREKIRRNKSGAMLNAEFFASNVEPDRLTLDRNVGVGFLSRGKSSLKLDNQDLPDLTFSKMRFLEKKGQRNQAATQPSLASNARPADGKRTVQELSSFLTCSESPNTTDKRDLSLSRGPYRNEQSNYQAVSLLARQDSVQHPWAFHERHDAERLDPTRLNDTAHNKPPQIEAIPPKSSRFKPTLPSWPDLQIRGSTSPLCHASGRVKGLKQSASHEAQVDGRFHSLAMSDGESFSLEEYARRAVIGNQPGTWRTPDVIDSSQKAYSLEDLKGLASNLNQHGQLGLGENCNVDRVGNSEWCHYETQAPEDDEQTEVYITRRTSISASKILAACRTQHANRSTSNVHEQKPFGIDKQEVERSGLITHETAKAGWQDIRAGSRNRIDLMVPNSTTLPSQSEALDLVNTPSGQHSRLNVEGADSGCWPNSLSIEAADVTFPRPAWVSAGYDIQNMPRSRPEKQASETDNRQSRFFVPDAGFERRHSASSVCLDEFDASLLLEASEIQIAGCRDGVEAMPNSVVESQIPDASRTNRPTALGFVDARHTDSQRGEQARPWMYQNDFQPFVDHKHALKPGSTLLHVSDAEPWLPTAGRSCFFSRCLARLTGSPPRGSDAWTASK